MGSPSIIVCACGIFFKDQRYKISLLSTVVACEWWRTFGDRVYQYDNILTFIWPSTHPRSHNARCTERSGSTPPIHRRQRQTDGGRDRLDWICVCLASFSLQKPLILRPAASSLWSPRTLFLFHSTPSSLCKHYLLNLLMVRAQMKSVLCSAPARPPLCTETWGIQDCETF